MTPHEFEQQVRAQLERFLNPDPDIRDDALLWFQQNALQARSFLYVMADHGDATARSMLERVNKTLGHTPPKTEPPPRSKTPQAKKRSTPDPRFVRKVQDHLNLFNAPDYTAKGDAVNFFRFNAGKALPILEMLAEQGDKDAQMMLEIARNALKGEPRKGTFMENNPDLF